MPLSNEEKVKFWGDVLIRTIPLTKLGKLTDPKAMENELDWAQEVADRCLDRFEKMYSALEHIDED